MLTLENPSEGKFVVELPYAEAEFFLRAVGMVNTGNLHHGAPELLKVVDKLVTEFGRNTRTEAHSLFGEIKDGQVFVHRVDEW